MRTARWRCAACRAGVHRRPVPTPAERSALLFVAAIAALGAGMRGLRAMRPTAVPAASREALAQQIAAVDSAVMAGGRRRSTPPQARASAAAGRPAATAAPVPVDMDRAAVEELQSLPGIGPALAARIVANRDSAGDFGSLERLQDVRGIGPALAARLAPLVTFSGMPRPAPPQRQGRGRPHP